MNGSFLDELTWKLTYPEYISHQRPSSRTDFNDIDILPLALCQPLRVQPDPNQFSKDLAYFWRCDEVAFRAELVMAFSLSSVVSAIERCEALAHIRGNGYWASGLAICQYVNDALRMYWGITVIASVSAFARGVDHCRWLVDDHRRPHRETLRGILRVQVHRDVFVNRLSAFPLIFGELHDVSVGNFHFSCRNSERGAMTTSKYTSINMRERNTNPTSTSSPN